MIDQKRQWQVFAVDKKGHRVGPPTYILATTRQGAERAGLSVLRSFGLRLRRVEACPYDPTKDFAMHGYVRRISEPTS